MAGHKSSRCLKDDLSMTFIPESALGGRSVNASLSATSIMPTTCSGLLVSADEVEFMFIWSSRNVELSESMVSASDAEDWDGDVISNSRCTCSRFQCGRPSGGLRWL
jgi:hypothetical protein